MLSKAMKRAWKRPDWVDLVPAEWNLLERLIPRRSTLRSDRRHGSRAASPRRFPFLIECQGTERSFNEPRRAAHDAVVEVSGSAVSVPRVEFPTITLVRLRPALELGLLTGCILALGASELISRSTRR
jgi:hypothetical protein